MIIIVSLVLLAILYFGFRIIKLLSKQASELSAIANSVYVMSLTPEEMAFINRNQLTSLLSPTYRKKT